MPKPVITRKPKEGKPSQEAAYDLLRPLVKLTLALLPEPEFTTRQFIIYMRATNPGEDAYTQAVSLWKDNFTLGRQTIHGQVVPQLLREEGAATWVGYVYNDPEEEDGLSVPSRWLKPGYTYPED
ncbi:MAG: hypothetical protein JWP00_4312 [Chloroflexi bacterium]|jgi:hypothetical protein|nr:hypothetical protein [Chloroflexota bacterium]